MVVRENYEFVFKISVRIENLIKPLRKYFYSFAKYATVVSATFAVGMIVPITYHKYKNTSLEELNRQISAKAQDIQSLYKKQEVIVPSEGVYYGYYFKELNKHPKEPVVKMLDEESPTLVMFYDAFNQEKLLDIEYLKRLDNKGVLPVITWEPWDIEVPENPLNLAGNPQKMILDGEYDEYITSYARGIKEYSKPVFIRFAHEMNGNWYPWGKFDETSPEDYKKMWRYMRDIFEQEGADNAVWVWSPNNTDAFGKTEGVLDYYPGDNYVDWVGYSAFNWGASNHYGVVWHDFEYISFEVYSKLSQLNKPIMVAETSSVSRGGDKTAWFYNMLSTYVPQMSRIKAVVIYNDNLNDADFNLLSGMDYPDVIRNNIINNGYYLTKPLYIYR